MRIAGYAQRKNEHGVSLLIVALALLALIAMAALSIDVASLYTARGEAQRAANAGALAGARMFVSSSYTSASSAWSDPSPLCVNSGPGSTAAANRQAEAATASNLISGRPAQIQTISCDLSQAGNPRITVTALQTGVPTFFARIWRRGVTTVAATATAEAYNASAHNQPIELTNVKPWLVPNCDPTSPTLGGGAGNTNCDAGGGNHFDFFIDPANGTVNNSGSFIGKEIILNRVTSGAPGPNSGVLNMYGLDFPDTPAPVCPSSSAVSCGPPIGGIDVYLDNVACASQLPIHCGERIGNGENITATDTDVGLSPTSTGGKCLIHADDDGPDQGQDSFSKDRVPVVITGGTNNPDPSLRGVDNISRSDSIVTLPVDAGVTLCPTAGSCTATTQVIGFLQVAVEQTTNSQPRVPVVIVNAVGCSASVLGAFPPSPGTSISTGGSSPVLVRLVQP